MSINPEKEDSVEKAGSDKAKKVDQGEDNGFTEGFYSSDDSSSIKGELVGVEEHKTHLKASDKSFNSF